MMQEDTLCAKIESSSVSIVQGRFCPHIRNAREDARTGMGRRQKVKQYAFYNEMTEPFLPMITTPIPRSLLPGQARARRQRTRGPIGAFFAAIIIFINTLLSLALVLLLL